MNGSMTQAVRVAQFQDSSDSFCEPIALTAAYVFESAADAAMRFSGASCGNVYSRFTNPTVRAFERRLAVLEGAEDAVAFSSGMAAIAAIAHARLQTGANVVCSRDVFGTTLTAFRSYFAKFGVDVRIVDLTDLAQWYAAIDDRTSLAFLETPSNPLQQVADIRAVASLVHAHGGLLAVDNTMLTPILQKPLLFGADLVVHSAGKYIDGQGRCVAGVVAGPDVLMEEMRAVTRSLGPTLSAMNAWLLLKSLETLELRVEAIAQSTQKLANWLKGRREVGAVYYSGFRSHLQRGLAEHQQRGAGGVVSFEVGDSRESAWAFIDALRLISIATNIGDTRSMVTHPATTTHGRLTAEERSRAGIHESLVRLSVGLESVDDLQADIEQALLSVVEPSRASFTQE
ncbi:O-succinylhomoserine sulfhydrylase [Cupriavidus necator]|uniref:O-succinylhomoserine sulfhydrylase n=1 Tax=Cupriavidus necator TaxID=106590 RepID=A0A1U9UPC6_CUPNE|nr:aminotransferase class I/II-fold pyridoxal phosphate-dependent enzyme [Cupriavidus necator]AQV94498.1 O-succinylhomoserine sulfhydrylase [Cupriavidus necator]